ncbi:hypothetical protein CEXT_133211 [Caerostris extrusa]|uniref:Uncharacterized protein n=1 Tax=Caerostris extrusa TaxID=172846 RepID=A0AAV4P839_CAEEX|nr:hypothetical protein CEXT_133211 [Caerostris extrusa]
MLLRGLLSVVIPHLSRRTCNISVSYQKDFSMPLHPTGKILKYNSFISFQEDVYILHILLGGQISTPHLSRRTYIYSASFQKDMYVPGILLVGLLSVITPCLSRRISITTPHPSGRIFPFVLLGGLLSVVTPLFREDIFLSSI